jgi:sarcosine oxidase, subunit beta
MKHFDVVVVGAGIAGASTAFFLRKRGIGVALVEKSHPAGGPTGKSSAIADAFYLMPELSQLAIKGMQTLREIPELTGEGPVYSEIGQMWGCGDETKAIWSTAARRINHEGSLIEEISAAELVHRYPDINADGIVLALWAPGYGYADPYGATNALAKAARDNGAEGFMSTTVRTIATTGGKVTGVELVDGRMLSADVVVVAAGPWTKALVSPTGYDLPIFAERHEMAALEANGRARDLMPFCWQDDLQGSYARPDGDRVILAGTWAGGTGIRHDRVKRPERVGDLDNYREGLTESEAVEILSPLVSRFPKLEVLGLRPGYAAMYDMSPDDKPIIGPIAAAEGLYVICGSSGHGFKLGPAIGEEVARLIATKSAPILSPFSADRFR